MSETLNKLEEFEKAMLDFVESFELVFDVDWPFTAGSISCNYLIKENGTFINPGVDDESNNWGNRGSLLSSYRTLKKLMHEQGVETIFDKPPDPLDLS